MREGSEARIPASAFLNDGLLPAASPFTTPLAFSTPSSASHSPDPASDASRILRIFKLLNSPIPAPVLVPGTLLMVPRNHAVINVQNLAGMMILISCIQGDHSGFDKPPVYIKT